MLILFLFLVFNAISIHASHRIYARPAVRTVAVDNDNLNNLQRDRDTQTRKVQELTAQVAQMQEKYNKDTSLLAQIRSIEPNYSEEAIYNLILSEMGNSASRRALLEEKEAELTAKNNRIVQLEQENEELKQRIGNLMNNTTNEAENAINNDFDQVTRDFTII
jgi:uncharacterized protein (DUF342 family)